MTKGAENAVRSRTLRLKTDLFNEIVSRRGWSSNEAVGRAFGVPGKQVSAIRKGEKAPTAEFIAGFLEAVPEAGFRRCFDNVPATDTPKEVPTT